MFVVDARIGLTPNDRAFAEFRPPRNKPWCGRNKAEASTAKSAAMESYALDSVIPSDLADTARA